MTIDDFRRIALSLEGAEEGSHMGQPDFRVGGRIFATLASADQGYGNVKLTPEQQAALVEEMPEIFIPIPGGWGRMGMTHVRLASASEGSNPSSRALADPNPLLAGHIYPQRLRV